MSISQAGGGGHCSLKTKVTARRAELDTKSYQMLLKITKKAKLHPPLRPRSSAAIVLMLIKVTIWPKFSVPLQITQNTTQKHFVDKPNLLKALVGKWKRSRFKRANTGKSHRGRREEGSQQEGNNQTRVLGHPPAWRDKLPQRY